MYCKHCGKEFDEKEIPHDPESEDSPNHQGYVNCPECSGQNTRPLIEHNIPPILNLLVKPLSFGGMFVFLLTVIIGSAYFIMHKDDMPDPKKRLESLYQAIGERDTAEINTYFESSVNNDVLRDKCFDLILSEESNTEYADLEISTISENEDEAEVRVIGQLNIMFNSMQREYPFNHVITLYAKDGNWMVPIETLETSNSFCGGF
jgi:uncharacterized membrane protein YvbJ